jgi:hypothetical protein
MSYVFHVRTHPLGVVVSMRPRQLGELLLPGENCCGVEFDELVRVAETTGYIEVPDGKYEDCPLNDKHQ